MSIIRIAKSSVAAGRGAVSPALHRAASVTIRFAFPDDAEPLERLAIVDSQPAPENLVLVAEVGGELWAALAADGTVIADPFRPTLDVVLLLRERARQLEAAERHRRQAGLRRLRRLPRRRLVGG
jgi:hypothetical protein